MPAQLFLERITALPDAVAADKLGTHTTETTNVLGPLLWANHRQPLTVRAGKSLALGNLAVAVSKKRVALRPAHLFGELGGGDGEAGIGGGHVLGSDGDAGIVGGWNDQLAAWHRDPSKRRALIERH